MPLFTVLITTYNYGQYIEQAVKSAIHQTLSPDLFEIIVVDDGSTDDTADRLKRFGEAIFYHFQDNAGQAAAFNKGIELARGEFVAFLDADDIWHPEKLACVGDFLRRNSDVDLLYHPLCMIDMNGEKLGVHPKYEIDHVIRDPLIELLHSGLKEPAATSGIVCRLDLLKQIYPVLPDYRICADSYIAVTTPLLVTSIGYLGQPFAYYRIHSANGYSSYDENSDSYACRKPEVYLEKVRLDLKCLDIVAEKLCGDPVRNGYYQRYRLLLSMQEMLLVRCNYGLFKALLLLLRSTASMRTGINIDYCYRMIVISIRLLIGDKLFFTLASYYVGSRLHSIVRSLMRQRSMEKCHGQ